MISFNTLQNKVKVLETVSSHEEQLYKILEIYMDSFPVLDAHLFRYSPFGYLAEGILAITPSGLIHIREMREDIRSLPIIYSAIQERKAKYCCGVDYLIQTNSKYIISSNITSMTVTPICMDSVVMGYICSSEFENNTHIEDSWLNSLSQYGKLIGKVFERSTKADSSPLLSRRELEVMKRISWGESNKEMAVTMGLSELTIKQYVKTAIDKIGALNRAHAVSVLLRKGIIN
ncbi:LuxR C-terminal-related transcriptional regulator [Niallia oryzisoli]|uniref:LuxR C-terminal-related transcriptional regulator n=1 Tax=Niallia oryzisoli TaxID=1737571 RepID=A0ABZ2CBT5_9BACI